MRNSKILATFGSSARSRQPWSPGRAPSVARSRPLLAARLSEYEFTLEESGTYVVEMLMVDGYVVALSNAGSVARSETLQTVVQLPGRWDFGTRTMAPQQDMSNFFGMSAETTMTASTIQIAVAQDIAPADAGTPVSPH